ncbi:MAG TPA: ABC transporter ATP-binding protein [Pirellulaceae bacterium]|nr:ABC transporter ATP-binding protein [Pirellulaceae bacterium]
MSAAIRLDQVTKRFGSQLALDKVSLEVAPGTVFALLGENGAGKSTTIRLLLGLAEPDSGHASVFGMESVTHSLEIRRCVGYVAERPTLYEWMTVDEIGWFTAGFYGANFLATYKDLIKQFALPPNKKLKTLSKGMRAKVALALSMGHDPDLLILDEPTSGLDTMVRREFLESMVDRAASGKTVFLSSHQIHEVERVADIVGIMRQGKLIIVERLEKLKAEVQELTITLSDASGVPPLVAGELLRQRRRSRQWQLLVRNGERESLQQLGEHEAVENVEVRTPSLEEIFVAYMKNDGGTSSSEAVEQLV